MCVILFQNRWLSYYLKGMPRDTVSAAFLNIVQKVFDPPPHLTTHPFGFEHIVAIFWQTLLNASKRLLRQNKA